MPRVPEVVKRNIKRAGKVATGIALGANILGFARDVRKETSLPKAHSIIEERKLSKSAEEINKDAENYYAKLNAGKFTKKDASKLVSQINFDLEDLRPDLEQAGFFNLDTIKSELTALTSFFVDRPISNAKNDPFGMFAAQIIALASFLQLAKNMRRLGFKQGYKVKEPFRLDNYKYGPNKAIPFVMILVANVYHISLIAGLITNPTLRYYVSKLLQKIK